jgi:hypothetical protein
MEPIEIATAYGLWETLDTEVEEGTVSLTTRLQIQTAEGDRYSVEKITLEEGTLVLQLCEVED